MNMLLNTITILFLAMQDTLKNALNIFWKGMLAIVIVITIIFFVVTIINKISADQAKKIKNNTPDNDNK